MKKVLFINTWDNSAFLVKIDSRIPVDMLRLVEKSLEGPERVKWSWKEIMRKGDFKHELISSGDKSLYQEGDYDETYELITAASEV